MQGWPKATGTDYDRLSRIMGLKMDLMAAKFEGRTDDARAIIARLKLIRKG